MPKYDSALIYTFAGRLYSRAESAIVTATLIGAVIGAVMGYAGGAVSGNGGTFALVAAVIMGAIGYSIGSERAFQLKLQAQVALCQVQIEENTRRGVSGGDLPSSLTRASRPAV
jgi:hypothetical protein